MTHVQPAVETKYDFALQYRRESPYRIGQTVPSGVSDDLDSTHHFAGVGSVVLVEEEFAPSRSATVYVRVYPAID